MTYEIGAYLALVGSLACAPVLWAQDGGVGNNASQTKARNKGQEPAPVRIFNPNKMAKATVGYSQVAEVSGGR